MNLRGAARVFVGSAVAVPAHSGRPSDLPSWAREELVALRLSEHRLRCDLMMGGDLAGDLAGATVEPFDYLADDVAWNEKHFGGELLDTGIIRIVRIFQENGVETQQSCEGPDGMVPEGRHGVGHCYVVPTIDIIGEPWKALDVARNHAAQVDSISEIFEVRDGRPVEHFWRIQFNSLQLARFRDSWYKR